ncbi:MAG: ArnT family glycosyltransferase, partial [Anaerolineales bacterium]
MNQRIRIWLEKNNLAILLSFAVIAILAITPHLGWGLPAEWHPDEIANDVRKAVEGKQPLLDNNYDYPMLPKIFMYAVGRIVFHFSHDASLFFLVVRFISAILAAAILLITYHITRAAGGKKISGLLASMLCLSSSELFLHAHFAHNDLYLVFFASLSVYALLQYQTQHSRVWFFLANFLGGLAIASKYNGIGLILAIVLVFFYTEKLGFSQQPIQLLKTLFIGVGLCLLAYVLSNPTAALHPLQYLHNLLPALHHHSIYARTPISPLGAVGQWQLMIDALGMPVFLLLIVVALYAITQLLLMKYRNTSSDISYRQSVLVLLIVLIALDLPILLSYNLQARFILPLLPPAFALAALSIE